MKETIFAYALTAVILTGCGNSDNKSNTHNTINTMNLEIQHVEVHVASLEKAREFYVNKLGLEVIEETPALNLFSVRAGGVCISIFGGYEPNASPFEKKASTYMIFRTDNIEQTMEGLKKRGIEFKGEIFEAPGFIRDISTTDPGGNVIEIAQYLRDPLKKVN